MYCCPSQTDLSEIWLGNCSSRWHARAVPVSLSMLSVLSMMSGGCSCGGAQADSGHHLPVSCQCQKGLPLSGWAPPQGIYPHQLFTPFVIKLDVICYRSKCNDLYSFNFQWIHFTSEFSIIRIYILDHWPWGGFSVLCTSLVDGTVCECSCVSPRMVSHTAWCVLHSRNTSSWCGDRRTQREVICLWSCQTLDPTQIGSPPQ